MRIKSVQTRNLKIRRWRLGTDNMLGLMSEYRHPSFNLVWFGLIWFGLDWFGLVWFGLDWFDLVWLSYKIITHKYTFMILYKHLHRYLTLGPIPVLPPPTFKQTNSKLIKKWFIYPESICKNFLPLGIEPLQQTQKF